MSFDEEWFPEASQWALSELGRSTAGLEGRVIEIGCWQGRSTVALANAVWPCDVEAVDTWQGSPGEESEVLARGRDVLSEFRTNVAELTKGNINVHAADWRAYRYTDSTPVRLLHIDGEHTYVEVYDTIRSFLPLMVAGGIICGDDAHHDPVIRAVTEVLGTVRLWATLWIWEKADGDN